MDPTSSAVRVWCLALYTVWGPTSAMAQSIEAEPPTVEVVNQRLLETEEDPSLDDATKARIRNVYQQVLSELESAARWRVTAQDYARRTTEAPAALEVLDAALAPPEDAPPILVTDSVDALEQRRAEVEGRLEEAASRLTEA